MDLQCWHELEKPHIIHLYEQTAGVFFTVNSISMFIIYNAKITTCNTSDSSNLNDPLSPLQYVHAH